MSERFFVSCKPDPLNRPVFKAGMGGVRISLSSFHKQTEEDMFQA